MIKSQILLKPIVQLKINEKSAIIMRFQYKPMK